MAEEKSVEILCLNKPDQAFTRSSIKRKNCSNPASVDEDLCGVGDGGRRDLLQVLHAPLLQELEDGRRRVADGNVRHQSKVLHL